MKSLNIKVWGVEEYRAHKNLKKNELSSIVGIHPQNYRAYDNDEYVIIEAKELTRIQRKGELWQL